jgi:hypothetical protein
MGDLLFTILILFFIAAPVFELGVSILLFRAMRRGSGDNPALLERFLGSLALFISGTLVSALSLNRLFDLQVPNDTAILLLTGSLGLINVPAFIWLYMYFTGKFKT